MQFKSTLSGFDGFSQLLKELPPHVENQVLQNATIAAVKSAQPAIKAAAPVSADDRSPSSKKFGRLKSNIRVSKLRRVKKGQKGARIHTGKAFWGFLIEKGTRFMAAHPWFAPAWRAREENTLRVLGEEIGKGIEEKASKYKGGRR